MRGPRVLWLSLFGSALSLGCPKDSTSNDAHAATTLDHGSGSVTSAPGSVSATDGTMGSTPTMATTTTGVATTTDDGSTGEGCLTANCEDMMKVDGCDNFAQDCPEGQKCAPYIPSGGGSYVAVKCVDVTGTDKPGDVCTYDHPFTAIDSCIEGAMCWNVNMDGVGTCIALCTGSPDRPVCEDPSTCAYSGTLNLCMTFCNPLLQDCPYPTEACYGPTCAPDASGEEGQANDPCEWINECDEGLVCSAFVGEGCASDACCTPYCEFPDGPCPNPDQECVQYFDPVLFPESKVGLCGVPE